MSTTTYAQLNIGRNVGNTPMGAKRWDTFVNAAALRLALAATHSYGDPATGSPDQAIELADSAEVHWGTGTWHGVAEESARISLYHEGGIDIKYLEHMACALATVYKQDAIAVITGSVLCQPSGIVRE